MESLPPRWLLELFILSTLFWTTLYFYFTRNFTYWKHRHVDHLKPLPFFGNALPIFLLRQSIGDLCAALYARSTKPFFGFFICDDPCLLLRAPELIKQVLIKDFAIFNDRTMTDNKRDDPMGSHILFVLKNPDWKEMRRKITPVFTSGKMKLMYRLIREAGEDLVRYLEEVVVEEGRCVVESRELAAKYTTDAITSTSFGINANCFRDEDAEFRQVSRRIFNWHILERGVSTTCYFVAPKLVRLFKLKFIDSFSANFLRKAFWKTMKEREASGVVRNDLLDVLMEIRRNEDIDDPFKLESDKLVAQATQFFIAGYETTSTTISFTLYEMALNPAVQNKLREEVLRVKGKYGEVSYEALKEMELLDRCIKETLRKYPSVPFLDRRCNSDYTIPGTDVTLKKGTAVFVPTLGLHYDPEYFPEPQKYDPDRFLEDTHGSSGALSAFTYLPFGEGPRNCIGNRFGTLSSKCGVAHILSRFKVSTCSETQSPMKFDPRGFLVAPIGGLKLNFQKLD